ncbi:Uncharacterised protein [Mycobacterium tuberculosis]|uniref:Transmembrane protein n=1 Tax=Mycobacterium tuberculosis TaxID=1773 RepID=A0A654U4G4_MYCTX|nr:Uncharacterised protein [Mycobacterium tuberculosis]
MTFWPTPRCVTHKPLTSSASAAPPIRASIGVAIRGSVKSFGASYPIQAITAVGLFGSAALAWLKRFSASS